MFHHHWCLYKLTIKQDTSVRPIRINVAAAELALIYGQFTVTLTLDSIRPTKYADVFDTSKFSRCDKKERKKTAFMKSERP